MDKFVSLKKDICCDNVTLRENEIGIVKDTNNEAVTVNFVTHNTTIRVRPNDVSFFDPAQTGDQFDKKICNVCNRLLDVELFKKNQNAKNNRTVRRPSCNECRAIIEGQHMTYADKKKMGEIKPNMEIWTCPICKKTTVPGLTSKVVCDHNHENGQPRAWICDSCNTGLGRFKDDIGLLTSAIEYLKSN